MSLLDKEGVDGSSPPEGSAKVPLTGLFGFSFRSTCSVGSARRLWNSRWSSRVKNALHRRVRGVSVGRPVGLIALPDFDQVAVRVAEVAAGFLPAVDWGCEEVGASLAPGLVDGLDVGDADVQEAAHAIRILWRLENDARLVVGWSAADV